jgi:dTDP-4-amino-4,6-dideoxygalactose transaminase
VGNLGDYSFFSFRTSKNIGVGSGAIILSEKKINLPLRKSKFLVTLVDFIDLVFRSKIINFSKPRAILEKIFEKPENREMGNFQKNLLRNKLQNIDKKVGERIKNYYLLWRILKKVKNLKNIKLGEPISPLYFPIISRDKEKAIRLFKAKGIGATGYYDHVNSDFFKLEFFGRDKSDFFAEHLINLPLHEDITQKEMKKIIGAVLEVDRELNDT